MLPAFLRTLFRYAWKTFTWTAWLVSWYAFLTSPITFLSVVDGVHYAYRLNDYLAEVSEARSQSLLDLSNDWGVGAGAPSFRQWQDINNDYHITRLNSDDWTRKLSFNAMPHDGTSEWFGPMWELEYVQGFQSITPKDQWVYITLDEWLYSWDVWDSAFDVAIQHAYAPGAMNDSSLFFVTCQGTGEWLCRKWSVNYPTLLHFRFEDTLPLIDSDNDGLGEGVPYIDDGPEFLHPVTVRVIDLPLDPRVFTGLPADVFPSPELQILTLMKNPNLVEQFEPYDTIDQIHGLIVERIESLEEQKGTFFGYLGTFRGWLNAHADNFLTRFIFDVSNLPALLSFALSELFIFLPYMGIKYVVREYFLGPSSDQAAETMGSFDPAENFWGGVMEDFWEHLEVKQAEDIKKNAQARKDNPEGQAEEFATIDVSKARELFRMPTGILGH